MGWSRSTINYLGGKDPELHVEEHSLQIRDTTDDHIKFNQQSLKFNQKQHQSQLLSSQFSFLLIRLVCIYDRDIHYTYVHVHTYTNIDTFIHKYMYNSLKELKLLWYTYTYINTYRHVYAEKEIRVVFNSIIMRFKTKLMFYYRRVLEQPNRVFLSL